MKPRKKRDDKALHTQIEKDKALYLSYYEQLPIHALACNYIGRDETTVIRWRKADPAWDRLLQQAKAKNAIKETLAIKGREWVIERTMRDHFAPPTSSLDLSSGGQPIVWDMGKVLGKKERKPRQPKASDTPQETWQDIG